MRTFRNKGIITFLTIVLTMAFSVSSVHAYTGAYGILPSPVGGPGSVTVTNFDVNTKGTGTQTIIMNLNYIQSMVIETSPGMKSNLLIKEYPTGQGKNFDVIVPAPLQNNLVQATLFVWAPDGENLVVEHDHQGAPIIYESATKVSPEVTDGNGNILWSFTVTSFSSFTFMESINDKVKRDTPWSGVNGLMILLVIGGTLAAPLGFKSTYRSI